MMSGLFGRYNHCRPSRLFYDWARKSDEVEDFVADARGLINIAVLDDYQNVALSLADWSSLDGRASITVFNDHVADPDMVVARLAPFQVVCVMRERTPMPRAIIERLPSLRLIASTGPGNASIDVAAATERGVQVVHTGYWPTPTIELTWALILAGARHLMPSHPLRSFVLCSIAAPRGAQDGEPRLSGLGFGASPCGQQRRENIAAPVILEKQREPLPLALCRSTF